MTPAFQEILSQSFLQKITFSLGSSANVTVECESGVTPYVWHDEDNGQRQSGADFTHSS
jgi:hypothetical protein